MFHVSEILKHILYDMDILCMYESGSLTPLASYSMIEHLITLLFTDMFLYSFPTCVIDIDVWNNRLEL